MRVQLKIVHSLETLAETRTAPLPSGVSGNIAGKRGGARHRATLLAEVPIETAPENRSSKSAWPWPWEAMPPPCAWSWSGCARLAVSGR